jgi:hypothetical protein
MPTGKQKNRKHRRRGPDGRFQEEPPARTPSPEAGPSNRLPAPSIPNPLPTLPTTPNTSTVTTPPRAPYPTRTGPRPATPPPAIPPPAIPPRPATWNYRELI